MTRIEYRLLQQVLEYITNNKVENAETLLRLILEESNDSSS